MSLLESHGVPGWWCLPSHGHKLTASVLRCVEMLIKEQMRKYKMKMEEINHLEAAESIAFRRLSLLRQNAVSAGLGAGPPAPGLGHGLCPRGMVLPPQTWKWTVWSGAL